MAKEEEKGMESASIAIRTEQTKGVKIVTWDIRDNARHVAGQGG